MPGLLFAAEKGWHELCTTLSAMRRPQPYNVVIASSAEPLIRRQSPGFALRLKARLNEIAEMAAIAPSSLVTQWSPSQQHFPPVAIEFEGWVVTCQVDERRRELRMVSLRDR